MRVVAGVVVAGLLSMGVAEAQSLLDGPLSGAAPSASSKATEAGSVKAGKTAQLKTARPKPTPPESAHSKTSHPRIMSHAKAPSSDAANGSTRDRDVPVARRTTQEDPLSLGMKWNGSNDNASQTRVQNYGGDAAGVGAAVGLKLHF